MQSFSNKKIIIVGLGKTGIAALKKLLSYRAVIYLYDDRQSAVEDVLAKFSPIKNNSLYQFESFSPHSQFDYCFVSPGVPNNNINRHKIIKEAISRNIPVISDIEMLQTSSPRATYMGITGTNGKSTTTSLIEHILNSIGYTQNNTLIEKGEKIEATVCGNIGIPVMEVLEHNKPSEIYVLELSSFQLDLLNTANCDIAICLNITPDHMDCYIDMEDYAQSKEKIFSRSDAFLSRRQNCYNIISVDYLETRNTYEKLIQNTDVITIPFSTQTVLSQGVSIKNEVISIANCLGFDRRHEFSIEKNDSLRGRHGAENIAAADATCLAYGCKIDEIVEKISSFKGLPHRMKTVLYNQEHNIRFINDSKATNTVAAGMALEALNDKNIYWIVGGICKDDGITTLSKFFNKIHTAYLVGNSTEDFASVCEEYNVDYEKSYTLDVALSSVRKKHVTDAVVLLSPACSSLDQWRNFEERGEHFTKQVRMLWS